MTHIVDIDMHARPELWDGGNLFFWLTEDLTRAARFDPIVWCQHHTTRAWHWDVWDSQSGFPLNKYHDRLALFDDASHLRIRLMFDSLDDALLFKLTWN